jgi:hypothetical protein
MAFKAALNPLSMGKARYVLDGAGCARFRPRANGLARFSSNVPTHAPAARSAPRPPRPAGVKAAMNVSADASAFSPRSGCGLTLASARVDVRVIVESGHRSIASSCQLSAKTGRDEVKLKVQEAFGRPGSRDR